MSFTCETGRPKLALRFAFVFRRRLPGEEQMKELLIHPADVAAQSIEWLTALEGYKEDELIQVAQSLAQVDLQLFEPRGMPLRVAACGLESGEQPPHIVAIFFKRRPRGGDVSRLSLSAHLSQQGVTKFGKILGLMHHVALSLKLIAQ